MALRTLSMRTSVDGGGWAGQGRAGSSGEAVPDGSENAVYSEGLG